MGYAAFEHFDDFTFGLAAAGRRPVTDFYLIAVHGTGQAAAGDEDVFAVAVHDDIGIAGARLVNAAFEVIRGCFLLVIAGNLELVVVRGLNRTGFSQFFEGGEHAVLAVFYFQLADQLLGVVLLAVVEF